MQSPLVKNADYIQDKGRYGPLKVKSSPAGYYIGTDYHTEDGYTEPGSRDSGYFGTRAEAEAELKLMEALEGEPPVDISTPERLRAFMAAATSLDDSSPAAQWSCSGRKASGSSSPGVRISGFPSIAKNANRVKRGSSTCARLESCEEHLSPRW